MSRRVSFSSEASVFGGADNIKFDNGNKKRSAMLNIWIFKLPRGSSSSVGRFFRNVGAKVSKALPMISTRRKCSGKVSSSPASLARLRSYAEAALDSQRAEAIEDCIEFFNNPSLQRSSSVNSSCSIFG